MGQRGAPKLGNSFGEKPLDQFLSIRFSTQRGPPFALPAGFLCPTF
jgi:hypothetical protein